MGVDAFSVHKRVGHIVVPYGNYAVAWGGFVTDQAYCPANEIFIYDSKSGIWSPSITTGDVPQPLSGCSAAIWRENLYIFGGCGDAEDGYNRRHYNDLYQLNLPTRKWTKLTPGGQKSPPCCDKGVAWAYDNKIYFFGGYGPRPSFLNSGYDFSVDMTSGSNGWNNSFFCYDIAGGVWSPVNVKGSHPTPEPRAAAAADVIAKHPGNIAFVFGGRKGSGRTNDLYAFNMSTQSWSLNLNAGLKNEEVPEPRSWTSFDFVEDTKAIVYGGLNANGLPAMDWWECRFNDIYDSVSWILRKSPIEPRIWHATAFCSPGELIVVGGGMKNPYEMEEKNHVNSMTILNYQPSPLYRLSLNAVVDTYNLLAIGVLEYSMLPQTLFDLVVSRTIQSGHQFVLINEHEM